MIIFITSTAPYTLGFVILLPISYFIDGSTATRVCGKRSEGNLRDTSNPAALLVRRPVLQHRALFLVNIVSSASR
jgi:hypothetical protein